MVGLDSSWYLISLSIFGTTIVPSPRRFAAPVGEFVGAAGSNGAAGVGDSLGFPPVRSKR